MKYKIKLNNKEELIFKIKNNKCNFIRPKQDIAFIDQDYKGCTIIVIDSGIDICDFFDLTGHSIPQFLGFEFRESLYSVNFFNHIGLYRKENEININFRMFIPIPGSLSKNSHFGNWYHEIYIGIFQDEIRDKVDILDEYFIEYALEPAYLNLNIEKKFHVDTNIKEAVFQLTNIVEKTILRTEQILEGNIGVHSFFLKTPNSIKTAIRQFLISFEKFVFISKDVNVFLSSFPTKNGIEIQLVNESKTSEETLTKWIDEFLQVFQLSSISNLSTYYETKVTQEDSISLIAFLTNQIKNLKNNLSSIQSNIEKTNKSSFLLLDSNDQKFQLNIKRIDVDRIEGIIADGDISKAFSESRKAVISNNDLYREIILLQGNFNRMKANYNKRVVTDDSYNIELNKIARSLLSLIK